MNLWYAVFTADTEESVRFDFSPCGNREKRDTGWYSTAVTISDRINHGQIMFIKCVDLHYTAVTRIMRNNIHVPRHVRFPPTPTIATGRRTFSPEARECPDTQETTERTGTKRVEKQYYLNDKSRRINTSNRILGPYSVMPHNPSSSKSPVNRKFNSALGFIKYLIMKNNEKVFVNIIIIIGTYCYECIVRHFYAYSFY